MAGNSHKHTRLVNYKRKRPIGRTLPAIWLIVPAAALLAFVLALILGNTLGQIADSVEPLESTPTASNPLTSQDIHGPITVNAPHVTLEGVYDNTAASVNAQIPKGATAVSMTLFNSDREPYYSSAVAASFGKACGELTLKNAFRPISEKDLYASVLFPSSLLANTDANKNATLSAYEATLISELGEAGANEIVVHFYKLGNDSAVINGELLTLMTTYASAVRSQSGAIRIGVTLTPTDMKNSSNAVTVQRLHQIVDFCALDLTSIESIDELTRLLLELSPDILRHEMRLLITRSNRSDSFINEMHSLLDRLGMKNVQYVG